MAKISYLDRYSVIAIGSGFALTWQEREHLTAAMDEYDLYGPRADAGSAEDLASAYRQLHYFDRFCTAPRSDYLDLYKRCGIFARAQTVAAIAAASRRGGPG